MKEVSSTEKIEEVAVEYVYRWNSLISRANWEKGRIISMWREAAIAAGSPAQGYSDEAWSRQVGAVTGQHVGRLRRVFERFGDAHTSYPGLFWSHFRAALEWHDAEMWLEGAMQNQWSVADMRGQRALASGEPHDGLDDDVALADTDEDDEAFGEESALAEGELREVRPAKGDAAFEDEEEEEDREDNDARDEDDSAPFDTRGVADHEAEVSRPFDNLPALPHDLDEAFENMKLAILRHKLADWREVSPRDVLAMLDGLKQLTTSPRGE